MSDPVGIPTAVAVNLESGFVRLIVGPPSAVPTQPIISFVMYRGPSVAGPWTRVAVQAFSEISAYVNLFDMSPLYGHTTYYTATAIAADGTASAQSTPLPISPYSS